MPCLQESSVHFSRFSVPRILTRNKFSGGTRMTSETYICSCCWLLVVTCPLEQGDSNLRFRESQPPVDDGSYLVDTQLGFYCAVGHRLIGEYSIRCRAGGRWSSSFPRCEGSKVSFSFRLNVMKDRKVCSCERFVAALFLWRSFKQNHKHGDPSAQKWHLVTGIKSAWLLTTHVQVTLAT